MSADVKYRTPYYYAPDGKPDTLASELSCMDAMCLFKWRLAGIAPASESRPFLKDFTITLKEDKDGEVCHVGALASAARITKDEWPPVDVSTASYQQLTAFPPPANTMLAIQHLEWVIANQGLAFLACADERIDVFISSISKSHHHANNQVRHFFAILGIENGEIHYVDTPIYIKRNRYTPHPLHRGIGVIRAETLLPALEEGYQLLSIADAPCEETIKTITSELLCNNPMRYYYDGMLAPGCHIGDQAYLKLLESLAVEGVALASPMRNNYYGSHRLGDYLDWTFYEMLNIRRTWARVSREWTRVSEGNELSLLASLDESVRLWRALSQSVCLPPNEILDVQKSTAAFQRLLVKVRNVDHKIADLINNNIQCRFL